MSVATFNDNWASLICEIDDRKIYNDIRSQIDITVTTVVIDDPLATYVYVTKEQVQYGLRVKAGGVYMLYFSLPTGYTIGNIWAEGKYYPAAQWISIPYTIISTSANWVQIQVTNNTSEYMSTVAGHMIFTYPELIGYVPQSHEETNTETLTIQTKDDDSIRKYGRRTMNLVWPLGQTQQEMESLAHYYLELYKEPRAYLPMIFQGKNDYLIDQILTRKIDDVVTIQSSRLGIDQDFFINSVKVDHDCHYILVGEYVLEEIPAIQSATIFRLDYSELDGDHILG